MELSLVNLAEASDSMHPNQIVLMGRLVGCTQIQSPLATAAFEVWKSRVRVGLWLAVCGSRRICDKMSSKINQRAQSKLILTPSVQVQNQNGAWDRQIVEQVGWSEAPERQITEGKVSLNLGFTIHGARLN